MNVEITAKLRDVKQGGFRYGNMESRYGANTVYFTRDGAPFLPIAGELHFSRCPRESWRRELLKMKDCGINTVSTYVFWNYHEEEKGKFVFSGDKDIGAFLALCRELGLFCVLRIGPWCHGEVIRGGFPKRIQHLSGKRRDTPRYLSEVEEFWRGLYREVQPFLDGETVLGIQLENEYSGDISHLKTLRRMAERIGFCTPFFTMTLWPHNRPDPEFLPMAGGYPDAPWARGKKPLAPSNRFAILPGRSEAEIDGDLLKSQKAGGENFREVPYASCETGPGNQVTQHRRPFISEKDGYGVGFAKVASGVNWLGYYMFHGGRNPNDRLMQESRRTGYPNNYPIIDYDFQAPLSRYGECRPHGDLYRLLHLFLQTFDPAFCTKQAFFPTGFTKAGGEQPNCSVRMDATMSGYFFVSAYEKGAVSQGYRDVAVRVKYGEKTIALPTLDVVSGAMFFYPFQIRIEGVLFEYILAQPITKLEDEQGVTCYFTECEGIAPRCSIGGTEIALPVDETWSIVSGGKRIRFIVLSRERAKQFHLINGMPCFAKGTVYADGNRIYCETTGGCLNRQEAVPVSVKDRVTLEPCARRSLPYATYLYSHGKRRYYSLRIDPALLKTPFDIRLQFRFTGLNLQVFSGQTLINDYFNIDGVFVMRLREYREYLRENQELIIRAVSKTRFGIGHVYQQVELPVGEAELHLESALEVQVLQEELTGKQTDRAAEKHWNR